MKDILFKVLMLKGDAGEPTDEQTQSAVNEYMQTHPEAAIDETIINSSVADWLDDHPEATTTVQDASLTESKFTNNLKLKTIKDYVTPQMFGAVGDGVTDDTQAIQDAVNYIYSKNITGGILFFPDGIYAISQPIEFYLNKNFDLDKEEISAGDGAITPEIIFLGESNSNVIIKAIGSCEYLFKGYANAINWLQNVTFKNLLLDGNEIAMSSVDMTYTNYGGFYTYFINCYITNFTEAGIKYISATNTSAAPLGENTRITVEKCKIIRNEYGLILAGDDFNIIETTIQNNYLYGIYINGAIHRISFVRCKIQYNGLGTTRFAGGQVLLNCSGQNLLFDNCYFENKSSVASNNDTGVIVIKATANKSFQNLTISNCYVNVMHAPYFINYVNDYLLTLQNIHLINNTIRNLENAIAYLIYVSNSSLDATNANATYVSRYLEEKGTRIEHIYNNSQDSKFTLYNGYSYEGYGGSIKSSYGAWSPNTSENLRGCIPTIFAGAFSDSLSQAMPKVGNYSVEKSENTGEYNVTFDDPINVAGGTFNYYPVFAKVDSSNPLHHAYVKNQSVNGFTIVTGTFDNTYSEFTPTFLRFSFLCAFVTQG